MVDSWVRAFTMKPAEIEREEEPVIPRRRIRSDMFDTGGASMREGLMTFKEQQDIQEVQKKEVDAMKKLSKDMQKVLVSYQKIVKMGDK